MAVVLSSNLFSDAAFPATHTLLGALTHGYILMGWILDNSLVQVTAAGNWNINFTFSDGTFTFDSMLSAGNAAAASNVKGNSHIFSLPVGIVTRNASAVTLVVSSPVNVTAVDTTMILYGEKLL